MATSGPPRRGRIQWRIKWHGLAYRPGDLGQDRLIVADRPIDACAAWVEMFARSQGTSTWYPAIKPNGVPEPESHYHCRAVVNAADPDGPGSDGGGIERIITYTDYPDEGEGALPCPRSIATVPAERRLLSDMAGARHSHGIQREYTATERIEWAPLTQEQADRWQEWYLSMDDGGGWFFADWPRPQAGAVLRRFVRPPQWDYIHGGTERRMWRISAECEVREDVDA